MSESASRALSIVIVLTWTVFLYRFYNVVRRRIKAHARQSPDITWSMWLPASTMLLAGTTLHPVIRGFFDNLIVPGTGYLVCNSIAILTYLLATQICYKFMPDFKRPRRNWPPLAATLTIVALTTLTLMTTPDGSNLLLASLVFPNVILVVTVKIIIPALIWSEKKERLAPTRLRIQVLRAMFYVVIVWMVNVLIYNGLALFSLGHLYPPYHPIATLTIVGVGVFFLLSFFIAQSFFLRLANLYAIVVFLHLRLLELHIYHWLSSNVQPTGRYPTQPSISDVFRHPEHATYRSVIAILDTCKLLKTYSHSRMAKLSARLSLVTSPRLNYPDVVRHLFFIARDDLLYLVSSLVTVEARKRLHSLSHLIPLRP